MTRPLRIEYEGAWYHVMNRGAARKPIFLNAKHRNMFLKILKMVHERCLIEIHAYCLMDNHYHLLVRTPLANLSEAMRQLGSLYTKFYNLSIKRDGPLFRGRFKSILVEEESYLLRLSRYIHLNPVKANLCRIPQEYRWSSYRYYFNPKNCPSWLNRKAIMSRFENSSIENSYHLFMNQDIDPELETFYKKSRISPILGGNNFISSVAKKYLSADFINEIPDHNLVVKTQLPMPRQIIETISTVYNVTTQTIQDVTQRYNNWPRLVALFACSQLTGLSYREISSYFGGISCNAITQRINRVKKMIVSNHDIKNEINNLLDIIRNQKA